MEDLSTKRKMKTDHFDTLLNGANQKTVVHKYEKACWSFTPLIALLNNFLKIGKRVQFIV